MTQLRFFLVLVLSIGAYGSECRDATIENVRLLRSGDDRSVSTNGTATLKGTDSYEIILRLASDLYITLYQPKWKWKKENFGRDAGNSAPIPEARIAALDVARCSTHFSSNVEVTAVKTHVPFCFSYADIHAPTVSSFVCLPDASVFA